MNKRSLSMKSPENNKRLKSRETLSHLQNTLQACGLVLNKPPEKCVATEETIYIIRKLKKNLTESPDYPQNVTNFFSDFKTECDDSKIFEHYLFPNIIRHADGRETKVNDSVIRILLNVSLLQNQLFEIIFDKVTDVLDTSECEEWVQRILKCLSTLNIVNNRDTLSSKVMDLLDISSNDNVRLAIISHIPDIVGVRKHDDVAANLCGIMVENKFLLPAILDCWSYLSLSDEQYDKLHRNVLNIMSSSNSDYFAIFVKFLLAPERTKQLKDTYIDTINGLRRELAWSKRVKSEKMIATSQVSTATAIKTSMVSSKTIFNVWLSVISKLSKDQRPIDFVVLLIMYSASHEYHRSVESTIRKLVKTQVFNEDLVDHAFEKFLPIITEPDNFVSLLSVAKALLKDNLDPSLVAFASHIYNLLFSEPSAISIIVSELIQISCIYKHSVLSILKILNKVATEKNSLLKPYSTQMLILLDHMDDMGYNEIKAVMDLVCCLAFSCENSSIRNDMNITIKKELSSCLPSVKIKGVLAGLHAVKYLMRSADNEETDIPDDVTLSLANCFSDGDLREAANMIDLINQSVMPFPHITPFFYDELFKIVQSTANINSRFLDWLTYALTNEILSNFIVSTLNLRTYGEITVSEQCQLNTDSEMVADILLDIAGSTLGKINDVHVGSLPSLFHLLVELYAKQNNGNLEAVNALLGCAVVMPVVDMDSLNTYKDETVAGILDCLVHCVNLFRELVNAFASQKENILTPKVLSRINNLRQYEDLIEGILLKRPISYKTPTYYATNVIVLSNKRLAKSKRLKPATHHYDTASGNLNAIHNIQLRPLDFGLLGLLNCELSSEDLPEDKLSFEVLNYLMKHINEKVEKTFLVEQGYDPAEAKKQTCVIFDVLPKVMTHIKFIAQFLDHHDLCDDDNLFCSPNLLESVLALGHLYNFCTNYFNLTEFKTNPSSLLDSLKCLAISNEDNLAKEDLLESVTKFLQTHEKYCLLFSTAVSLTRFVTTLQQYSTGTTLSQIVKNIAQKFLSKKWKTSDRHPEKGVVYNQNINTLVKLYLSDITIIQIKDLASGLVDDVKNMLKGSNNALRLLESINKHNFSILFKNILSVLRDLVKQQAKGSSTFSDHLCLWSDTSLIVKYLLKVVTCPNNKSISSHFCKAFKEILRVFLTTGLDVLKSELDENRPQISGILEVFGLVCNHSKLNSDDKSKKMSSNWIVLKESYISQMTLVCPEALKVSEGENRRNGARMGSPEADAGHNETLDDCDDQLTDDDSEGFDDDIFVGSERRSPVLP